MTNGAVDVKKIYENRADLRASAQTQDVTECECCNEILTFAMKDKEHAFSIGLSTILQCLAIAEKDGYVPKLPDEWWNKLHRY